ncbi:hypothetical protein GYMLUDRAFT_182213, partial [Collybiopsis luxurians FD-317 M1]
KFDLRKKITAAMIEVCKDRNDHEGVTFWEWVLVLLDRAGHDFMSDDEDITVLDRTDGKRTIARHIKQVTLLKWRHPYFLKLFRFIDAILGIENMVFQQHGKAPMERVRTSQVSSWPAPPGRPPSFYAPIFLASLTLPQKTALKMDEIEFTLRHFEEDLDD